MFSYLKQRVKTFVSLLYGLAELSQVTCLNLPLERRLNMAGSLRKYRDTVMHVYYSLNPLFVFPNRYTLQTGAGGPKELALPI